MQAVNPTTGEVIRDYAELDADSVDAAVAATARAFQNWRRTPVAERARLLSRVSDVLSQRKRQYAELMTLEMGKPITAAESEVDKCALTCRYYAERAAEFLRPEPVATETGQSYVRFDPLGPVLAVMPWNFPFWQVFRFAAPALAAGNVGLLKHAGSVPGCALAIEEAFRSAGAPEHVFTSLLIGSELVPRIIDNPAVAAVTLTGSDAAGRKVASRAAQGLKKAVLELGGSDAFVVLADADVELAAKVAAEARLVNSGQSCIAAKRFIVVDSIADRFETAFIEHMRAARVGDPIDRRTEVGPLVREDLLLELHRQVEDSVRAGARLLLGGQRLPRAGFFYPPTVLAHVLPGMPAFDEETFGPVAAVCRARDTEHAISLANESRYGLGAALWTRDRRQAEGLAERLEAGVVFVNGQVKSDPRLPFGGVKESGYGRELGVFGLREFVNVKSVWIE